MRTPPLRAECCRSSVVERILGKAEVGSSILPGSTIPLLRLMMLFRARQGPQPGNHRRLQRKAGIGITVVSRKVFGLHLATQCTDGSRQRVRLRREPVVRRQDQTPAASRAPPPCPRAPTPLRRPSTHRPSSPAWSPVSPHSLRQPSPASRAARRPGETMSAAEIRIAPISAGSFDAVIAVAQPPML